MNSLITNIDKQDIYRISFKNDKKNKFSPEDAKELNRHLDKLSNDKSIRGLLFVSSQAKFFCVGGDLKYYSSLKEPEPGITANKKIAETLERLSLLNIPTAVCVDGLCLGGGIELVSCFDYVVASNASLFSLWQRKIGLSFGWGGGERLARRLSHQDLKKKFLEASPITSYEALKINLVDRVVPRFQLEETATDWLVKVSSLPVEPLALMKKKSISQNEQSAFEHLWLSEDHVSALEKFKKGRKS